jgi:hypothetical protein
VLNKPFADVADEMQFAYSFTQRGMQDAQRPRAPRED